MRLALYLPNFRDKVTVSELDDLAHLAEELEFDSIWTAADGAPRRAGARRRRGDRGGGHRSGRVRTPFLTFADRNVRSWRRSHDQGLLVGHHLRDNRTPRRWYEFAF